MKILFTIIALFLLSASKLLAVSINLDSLRQSVIVENDSLKGQMYTTIAAKYLAFDTISNPDKKLHFQEAVIKNTLSAISYFSRYNDTIGLRTSFNNLAKVYQAQKKYSQAKWFILQSNTLSRAKNDVPNIISSLIVLATIKSDIKDYDLAMDDLNEALNLSVNHHFARTESAVQQNYAMLYSRMGNYTKEAIALKRHNFIDDSIRRYEEARLLAKINADSLLNKKKLYLTSIKRVYNSKKVSLLEL